MVSIRHGENVIRTVKHVIKNLKERILPFKATKRKENEVRVGNNEEYPLIKKKDLYPRLALFGFRLLKNEKKKMGFDEFKFIMVRKPSQPFGYRI